MDDAIRGDSRLQERGGGQRSFVLRVLIVIGLVAPALFAILLLHLPRAVRSWTGLSHRWGLAGVLIGLIGLTGLGGWLLGSTVARPQWVA